MKSIIFAVILFAGLQYPPLVGPLIPDSTGVVTGIVRRADTGQSIPEAQVVLVSPAESIDQAMTRATLTDLNGKFTIKSVMPGPYVVIAQSEGHFSLSGEPSASTQARKDVRVSEGQQTDAGGLELIPGATISGRVTGPEGQPLTGAIVQALRPSYIRGPLVFTAFKATRLTTWESIDCSGCHRGVLPSRPVSWEFATNARAVFKGFFPRHC